MEIGSASREMMLYFIRTFRVRLTEEVIFKQILPLSLFFFFFLFRDIPAAYGGSQARGEMGAVAASLPHGHSNARTKPRQNLHHSSRQC